MTKYKGKPFFSSISQTVGFYTLKSSSNDIQHLRSDICTTTSV